MEGKRNRQLLLNLFFAGNLLHTTFLFAADSLPTKSAPPRPSGLQNLSFVVDENSVTTNIEIEGITRRIVLQKHSLRSRDFKAQAQGANGCHDLAAIPVCTFRGRVEGLPESRVAASFNDNRLTASVILNSQDTWWIEPSQEMVDGVLGYQVYRMGDAPTSLRQLCAGAEFIPQSSPEHDEGTASSLPIESLGVPFQLENNTSIDSTGKWPENPPNPPMNLIPGNNLKVCQIALDIDAPFVSISGGSPGGAISQAELIMNYVDTIYAYEVGITYEITYSHAWVDAGEPYNTPEASILLGQLRSYWNGHFLEYPRDVVHLFTGRIPNNGDHFGTPGMAYQGSICRPDNRAYGLSQARFDERLPYRVALVAHQLGHNWNATHCDGNADCGIMCSSIGSCSNNLVQFGAAPKAAITAFVNASNCLTSPASGPDDSYESNNTPDTARPLYGNVANLQLLLLNDDWFAISLCQESLLSVSIAYSFAMTASLEVRKVSDGCPSILGVPDNINQTKNILQTVPPGTYLIHVSNAEIGKPGGHYWLSVNAFNQHDPICNQRIRYVRPAAPACGDGLSWETAFRSLRDALRAAKTSPGFIDQIWVAAGIYSPDGGYSVGPWPPTLPNWHSGNLDPLASFGLLDNVTIYGGFVGNETSLSQRSANTHDPIHETILSGDLNPIGNPDTNDLPPRYDHPSRQENSYHVLISSSTGDSARIDGFTIRGGNARSPGFPHNAGGGVYLATANPRISDCLFLRNCSRGRGGAASNDNSSPSYEGCTFTQNAAEDSGGGMANIPTSSPLVIDCSFVGNTANLNNGGAVYNHTNSSPTLVSCQFQLNIAGHDGGAIYNLVNSSPTVINSKFMQNSAARGGGAFHIESTGNSVLTNCVFSNNRSNLYGGALHCSDGAALSILNCTLSGNHSDTYGGAAWIASPSTLTAKNSILWGDTAGTGINLSPQELYLYDGAVATVQYSNVQGGAVGVGNIPLGTGAGVDPRFIHPASPGNDNIWGTGDDDVGDLHLQAISPCIDSGNSAANIGPVDFDRNSRLFDVPTVPNMGVGPSPVLDLGPFELQSTTPARFYVHATALGANNGATWADAFTNLESAFTAVRNFQLTNVQIWVAAGNYAIGNTLIPVNNVSVYGGFAGNEQLLADRGPDLFDQAHLTTLTVTPGLATVFRADSLSTLNVLDGFAFSGNSRLSFSQSSSTIRNCRFSQAFLDIEGVQTSFLILDCSFSNSTSNSIKASAVEMQNCTLSMSSIVGQYGAVLTVNNCSFSQCSGALSLGEGLFSNTLHLRECVFADCSVNQRGAALRIGLRSHVDAIGCKFLRNRSQIGGAFSLDGGSLAEQAEAVFINCIFSQNAAILYGGAGFCDRFGRVTFRNCAFGSNSCDNNGGALYIATDAELTLHNTILWGDHAVLGPEIWNVSSVPADVRYCNIQGWQGAGLNGNISADPLFVNSELSIHPTSPCADAGNNGLWIQTDGTIDINGNARFVEDALSPNTGIPGNGYASIIDIGAMESNGNWAGTGKVYVSKSATGLNTGTSWVDANHEVQDAVRLAAAYAGLHTGEGVEIWVSTANYSPSRPGGDINEAFLLANHVTLYGGFPVPNAANPSPTFSDRDPAQHITTLTGDLNGDGSARSYHVVVGTFVNDTARIDGFVIEGGDAGAPTFPGNAGGGMYLRTANATVKNCIIRNNHAIGRGGGVYDDDNSSPLFENCRFENNIATDSGGAMANIPNSSPTLLNCVFESNRALSHNGGAIYNHTNSSPMISDCEFLRNSAGEDGGAIYNLVYSSPELFACRFHLNSAMQGGGAFHVESTGNPRLIGCVFTNNRSNLYGGALHCADGATATVLNCTLTANHSDTYGGAVWLAYPSSMIVRNSIMWNDTVGLPASQSVQEIYYYNGASALIAFSDVQAGTPGPGNLPGGNGLGIDPNFVSSPSRGPDQIWGTNDDELGDIHLAAGSPCINTGDPQFVPTPPTDEDIDGQPRIMGPFVDIGADEYLGAGLAHSGDMNGNGMTDANDIPGFILAVIGPVNPQQVAIADMNNDGVANGLDLSAFVHAIIH